MELKLINVSKEYPSADGKFIRSLDSINLDINYGNYVSFVGPSGSGKSTLLGIMTGNLKPTSGDVFWGKKSLSRASDSELTAMRRQKLGIVFQDSRFFSELTVEDNMKLPLIINSVSVSEKKKYFDILAEQLKMTSLLKRYPYELSGGEKKKAAIARALMNNPEILIADEPTANLDEESAREVFAIFANLNKMGLTIVIATHDVRFGAFCRESYTMAQGRIERFTCRE